MSLSHLTDEETARSEVNRPRWNRQRGGQEANAASPHPHSPDPAARTDGRCLVELTFVFKSERSCDTELKTRSEVLGDYAASCDAELWFLQVTNGIRNEWQDQHPSPRVLVWVHLKFLGTRLSCVRQG